MKHIVSLNLPISVILDATADTRGKHYVIVYLKALEEQRDVNGKLLHVKPVVLFYKLIELGMDEDANAYNI